MNSLIVQMVPLLAIVACAIAAVPIAYPLSTQNVPEKDTIQTTAGALEITFVGHGTLIMIWDGKTIHIDPYSKLANYGQLPKADLVLITHHHGDHLDTRAMDMVCTDKTEVILTKRCAEQLGNRIVMKNGDVRTVIGIKIEAMPAYNLVHKRADGNPYHPKGEGNGYVLTFGATRVYVAGDTENTPEMKKLQGIDVAFLPMNLPYTMTPAQVADAAKAFRPRVLYPYHYGETDPNALVRLMDGEKGIEVRIREMR